MIADESLGTWLDGRLADVDADLAKHIHAVIPDDVRGVNAADGVNVLAIAASAALRELVAGECESRASAPALLVVDALVTYACQLAAEASSDVADSAGFVLRQIASVMVDGNVTA